MEGHRPLNQGAVTPPFYTFVGVNEKYRETDRIARSLAHIAEAAAEGRSSRRRGYLPRGRYRLFFFQLEIWGQGHRRGCDPPEGRIDPAAVVDDAIQAARARHVDVVLVDTAGRLYSAQPDGVSPQGSIA